MKILVTGGAGYIGSHTCVELLNNGYDVIVYDNLSNSCEKSLERVKEITGKTVKFIKGDILDKVHLDEVFTENQIDCVINFAGLKAVGESVKKPLEYYHTNITGAINILESMREHNCFKFIFSSSATVMEIQFLCQLMKPLKRVVQLILMVQQSSLLNKFLWIYIIQIQDFKFVF